MPCEVQGVSSLLAQLPYGGIHLAEKDGDVAASEIGEKKVIHCVPVRARAGICKACDV